MLPLALGLLLTGSLAAQESAPPANTQPVELSAPVPGVSPITLDVVPVTHSKETAPVLTQANVRILDNGKPAAITSFVAPTPGTRIAVILVLDAVDADYTSTAFQRQELDKFFTANGGQLAQPTALAIMTDEGVHLQEGFSTNGAPLKQMLDDFTVSLHTIRRSSGIYGAQERQQLGLSALGELARKELPIRARKVVIFISPGWPLLSGSEVQLTDRQHAEVFKTVVSLNSLLERARMTIYDVNPFGAGESVLESSYYQSFLKPVDRPGRTDLADLSLEVQATQTGGLVRIGSTDLARQIALCLDDAASAYQVTFLANPGGTEPHDNKSPYMLHTLQVEGPDGLKTRTRALYYTQTPQ